MTNWENKKRNWDKSVKYELENEERKEKAEDVAEFVEDKTGKGGKAEAGRKAIDLAHMKIQDLKKEEDKKKEELAEYYQKVDQVAEELKK